MYDSACLLLLISVFVHSQKVKIKDLFSGVMTNVVVSLVSFMLHLALVIYIFIYMVNKTYCNVSVDSYK